MKTWIEKIKDYTSYMSDVITAIRGQATSFTENTIETFTIEEVLKHVSILMKNELQQSLVNLNINNMANGVNIQGNMNILIQVINNLISNSIQSYQGEPNKNIDLEVTNKKNKLLIKITDYGMGIPEELKDKLFKEIVTTKGNNGTGLGLFISYSNIKNRISSETFHTLLRLEKEHLLKYYFQF
jgi:C4-dicarboxylate-specific signal transduction histidine kinase